MKKKTDTKTIEQKRVTTQKVVTALKSETAHFVIGLLCVIFGVYMLLAFSSFFFTGGNDQSILHIPTPENYWKQATASRTMPVHGVPSFHNT